MKHIYYVYDDEHPRKKVVKFTYEKETALDICDELNDEFYGQVYRVATGSWYNDKYQPII